MEDESIYNNHEDAVEEMFLSLEDKFFYISHKISLLTVVLENKFIPF